jgi:transcription-repair coupling factor (superfamily II helicase)
MARALAFFDPTMPVLRFPGWDCLPYDRVSPNPDISAARMATLAGWRRAARALRAADDAQRRHPARARPRGAARGGLHGEVGGQIDEEALRRFSCAWAFPRRPR